MDAIKVGGHLSVAGGYHNALTKTKEIGGNCVQIFSSSPRSWQPFVPTDEIITKFVETKKQLEIDPVYFHASYLINLANPDWGGSQSVTTLIQELTLAQKMGVKGTIIHLGSFKNKPARNAMQSVAGGEGSATQEQYSVLFKNISKVLENTPTDTLFIAENAGNRKIGWSLDELGIIVKTIADPRVKICIDTCHAHAAGYDLSTAEKFEQFWTTFDEKIGMDRLEVFQINDSKDLLGSFRDRHENIGEGTIPQSTFRLLMNHSLTKSKPMLLEVPGEDKKGPDAKNIAVLQEFLEEH